MTERQKEDLLIMQAQLGLIEMTEIRNIRNATEENNSHNDQVSAAPTNVVPKGRIVQCNGKVYDVVDNQSSEKDKAEYLALKNAYNIHKIRKGVGFFVTITVISIIVGFIALLARLT